MTTRILTIHCTLRASYTITDTLTQGFPSARMLVTHRVLLSRTFQQYVTNPLGSELSGLGKGCNEMLF